MVKYLERLLFIMARSKQNTINTTKDNITNDTEEETSSANETNQEEQEQNTNNEESNVEEQKETENQQDTNNASQQEETPKKSEISIKHYLDKYNNPELPPIWSIIEILSFGQCSKMFGFLNRDNKNKIARTLGEDQRFISSWVYILSHLEQF